MLAHRCNIIKAISGVVRVALGQLIVTSQSTAPHIISIMKLEKLGTDVC